MMKVIGERVVSIVLILVFLVIGTRMRAKESPKDYIILTSFTILEDLVRNVAGESTDVRVIAPIGAEVHEWSLTPKNFIDIEEAHIFFYNGLNLEQWIEQVRAISSPQTLFIPLGEVSGYLTLPIITGDFKGDPDPHLWMDVRGAISYVETIRDVLIEFDPKRSEIYQKNASLYIEELITLHEEIELDLSSIPDERRILITSEAAFLYFSKAYDLYHDAIWGTNTEEEGTPQQMIRILEIILEREPPSIFWESTGSEYYSLSVAQDTGLLVSGPLYVDSLGERGTRAFSYIEMMRENVRLLKEVLKEKEESICREEIHP